MTKGDFHIFDAELKHTNAVKSGNGIANFAAALPDSAPAWATYQYDDQYLVRIKWRPNAASGIAKTKANQSEQAFLNLCGDKTKVTVEVLAKKPLTDAAVWECIRPGSGTKVIDEGSSAAAAASSSSSSSSSGNPLRSAPAPAPKPAAAPAPAASSGGAPKFCPSCGEKNSGGKFCGSCGQKF